MTADPADRASAASQPASLASSEVADYSYWDGLPATDHGTEFVRHVTRKHNPSPHRPAPATSPSLTARCRARAPICPIACRALTHRPPRAVDAPLEIVVDGQSRHGVIMKQGKPFDVYVGQVDSFMALAQEQFNSTQ